MAFPTPIGLWIKNELRDYVYDRLLRSNAASNGLLDKVVVRKILSDHMKDKEDNNRLIFPLLNFEEWYDIYFRLRDYAGRLYEPFTPELTVKLEGQTDA
jgi:hypothetical protein